MDLAMIAYKGPEEPVAVDTPLLSTTRLDSLVESEEPVAVDTLLPSTVMMDLSTTGQPMAIDPSTTSTAVKPGQLHPAAVAERDDFNRPAAVDTPITMLFSPSVVFFGDGVHPWTTSARVFIVSIYHDFYVLLVDSAQKELYRQKVDTSWKTICTELDDGNVFQWGNPTSDSHFWPRVRFQVDNTDRFWKFVNMFIECRQTAAHVEEAHKQSLRAMFNSVANF